MDLPKPIDDKEEDKNKLLLDDLVLVLYASAMENSKFHWAIGIVTGDGSILKHHMYEQMPDSWEYEVKFENLFGQGVLVTCLKLGKILVTTTTLRDFMNGFSTLMERLISRCRQIVKYSLTKGTLCIRFYVVSALLFLQNSVKDIRDTAAYTGFEVHCN